ncbi:transcriptional regulator, LysR family [Modicisalibacter muralis]|uniref:Transcriptional regulator, LysR family n=1 Tax=Modicisalibacter muralis TaxID=119000 RepID=A0A1G9HXK9_9GAMM|nr:LysR family transcriptional regulator [Halomonas muralis]SDL17313.1 transcriptional regulator, LysR family [Halomonas muralis]
MDRFKAMHVFTRVVEAGSFTRAAETLEMPRATVTAAIQQLEAHLGVRLLYRTTRRVSLTLDGGAYYERCLRLLDELADTEAMFADQHRPTGRLKVNLPGPPARRVIIPALMAFCDKYPRIDLEMGVSDHPVDLIQEGVDCALRIGPLADSSLIARRLGQLTEISCAAPAYLERHGTPRTPADLDRHLSVNYHSGRTGRPLPWEYTEDGKLREVTMAGRLTVDNAEAYISAALAGFGLVQVPLYTAHHYLQRGELVEVLTEHRPAPSPMSVVYPYNRHLSSKVKVFVEWLTHTLRDQPGMV